MVGKEANEMRMCPLKMDTFFPSPLQQLVLCLGGADIGVGGKPRPSVGTVLDVTLHREYPATYM